MNRYPPPTHSAPWKYASIDVISRSTSISESHSFAPSAVSREPLPGAGRESLPGTHGGVLHRSACLAAELAPDVEDDDAADEDQTTHEHRGRADLEARRVLRVEAQDARLVVDRTSGLARRLPGRAPARAGERLSGMFSQPIKMRSSTLLSSFYLSLDWLGHLRCCNAAPPGPRAGAGRASGPPAFAPSAGLGGICEMDCRGEERNLSFRDCCCGPLCRAQKSPNTGRVQGVLSTFGMKS